MGKSKADVLVASIYVNPTQFGKDEDLANYPRDLSSDAAQCESAGADVVFAPTDEVMYPGGKKEYVEVQHLGTLLCGRTRPIHFRGVTTVCAKFFDIIKPWPISELENSFESGMGVMLDDVAAAIYTMILLGGANYVFFGG